MFISPRLCRPHLIYRYNYIVSLPCPTWQRNIKLFGSKHAKPERAPSCVSQHSGSPQPRITARSRPTLLCPLTSVPYNKLINIITKLIQHILRPHHNRNMDLTYIYRHIGLPLPSPREHQFVWVDSLSWWSHRPLVASAGTVCVTNWITAWITNE